MKYLKKYLYLAVIIFLFENLSVSGKCGGDSGIHCKNNECCSKYGYCGTSEKYCGDGCQPAFGHCDSFPSRTSLTISKVSPSGNPTVSGRCGTGYGGFCKTNQCCSKYGYCGTSEKHCGDGCQRAYGHCGSIINTTTKKSQTPTPTTGKSPTQIVGRCGSGIGFCSFGECCSKDGYCGTSENHCGNGCQPAYGDCDQFNRTSKKPEPTTNSNKRCGSGVGICDYGECCSKDGYCGRTSEYCDAGCQHTFGDCNEEYVYPTPTKSSTPTTRRCGPGYGFCGFDECCSKDGYCGTTSEYCDFCQPIYSGRCDNNNSGKKKRCGVGHGFCGNNECCSKDGYCGTTEEYCGKGCQEYFGDRCNEVKEEKTEVTRCGFKYGYCSEDECCSKKGYCGKTKEHCGEGCQTFFGGYCDDIGDDDDDIFNFPIKF